ncbi:MAG: signal peptidase I, partial [Arenimonas sp.]|nr:signal peptidase I [Arenimonas sp.]
KGTVFINDQPQPVPPGTSPTLGPGPGRDLETQVVPAGAVFVMGDNRDHSLDSRYFGTVPRESIVGRMARVVRQP